MSTLNQELKYLWSAVFEDGTQIDQPPDDHYSKHDETAEGNPSAFRDVLDKQEESKLLYFGLADPATKEMFLAVDLETGSFITDRLVFQAHPQNLDLTDKELQIVFHREVRRHTNLDGEVIGAYVNRYFIGWQIKGENITQTVAIL